MDFVVDHRGEPCEVSGEFHRKIASGNQADVGGCNSNVGHSTIATNPCADLPDAILDELVAGVFSPVAAVCAIPDDETTITTAIQFHAR